MSLTKQGIVSKTKNYANPKQAHFSSRSAFLKYVKEMNELEYLQTLRDYICDRASENIDLLDYKSLLSKGFGINDITGGWTLLTYQILQSRIATSVTNGHLFHVNHLISVDADVNKPEPMLNLTPLHLALMFGDVKIVESLLNNNKMKSVNALDFDKNSPLTYALAFNTGDTRYQLVYLLLQHGAKLIYSPKIINTLFISSIACESMPMLALDEDVWLSNSHKVDLNFADKNGSTPLITALLHKRFNVAKSLIDAKADINVPNTQGNKPIDAVMNDRSLDSLNFLLNYPDMLNMVDHSNKQTPLMKLLSRRSDDMTHPDFLNNAISALLSARADVTLVDNNGNNAIELAEKLQAVSAHNKQSMVVSKLLTDNIIQYVLAVIRKSEIERTLWHTETQSPKTTPVRRTSDPSLLSRLPQVYQYRELFDPLLYSMAVAIIQKNKNKLQSLEQNEAIAKLKTLLGQIVQRYYPRFFNELFFVPYVDVYLFDDHDGRGLVHAQDRIPNDVRFIILQYYLTPWTMMRHNKKMFDKEYQMSKEEHEIFNSISELFVSLDILKLLGSKISTMELELAKEEELANEQAKKEIESQKYKDEDWGNENEGEDEDWGITNEGDNKANDKDKGWDNNEDEDEDRDNKEGKKLSEDTVKMDVDSDKEKSAETKQGKEGNANSNSNANAKPKQQEAPSSDIPNKPALQAKPSQEKLKVLNSPEIMEQQMARTKEFYNLLLIKSNCSKTSPEARQFLLEVTEYIKDPAKYPNKNTPASKAVYQYKVDFEEQWLQNMLGSNEGRQDQIKERIDTQNRLLLSAQAKQLNRQDSSGLSTADSVQRQQTTRLHSLAQALSNTPQPMQTNNNPPIQTNVSSNPPARKKKVVLELYEEDELPRDKGVKFS